MSNSPTALGVKSFFDPARVVERPALSLPAGAVRGWDRRNAYYFQLLEALAAHYDFDLDTPFKDLASRVRKVILSGSGDEAIGLSDLIQILANWQD